MKHHAVVEVLKRKYFHFIPLQAEGNLNHKILQRAQDGRLRPAKVRLINFVSQDYSLTEFKSFQKTIASLF